MPRRAYFEKWPPSEDNTLFVRAKRRKSKGAKRKKKRERRRREERRKKDRKIRKKRKKTRGERTRPIFFNNSIILKLVCDQNFLNMGNSEDLTRRRDTLTGGSTLFALTPFFGTKSTD